MYCYSLESAWAKRYTVTLTEACSIRNELAEKFGVKRTDFEILRVYIPTDVQGLVDVLNEMASALDAKAK